LLFWNVKVCIFNIYSNTSGRYCTLYHTKDLEEHPQLSSTSHLWIHSLHSLLYPRVPQSCSTFSSKSPHTHTDTHHDSIHPLWAAVAVRPGSTSLSDQLPECCFYVRCRSRVCNSSSSPEDVLRCHMQKSTPSLYKSSLYTSTYKWRSWTVGSVWLVFSGPSSSALTGHRAGLLRLACFQVSSVCFCAHPLWF